MNDLSFYWHDYETFGRVPRRDRPSQFAGVRTDAELNEIGTPLLHYCRPAPDTLPDPEACLLTGILPQTCLQQGVPEHAFAAAIETQLAQPGTIGVGYNSIRFDDEVTRHLFWRNLIDPYAREWQNGCGRWDLLDVARCAWSLRPEGLQWPLREDGRPSFRLEDLTRANGIEHAAAHDALSDVRATVALARLLRQANPKLWAFCLRLRDKNVVRQEMESAQAQGLPFLHISGMYPVERGCVAAVWPLATHPTNKNEVIVWDLAADPTELLDLDADAIRQRLFTPSAELPEGVTRLPIKSIHLNKSPIVIGNMKTLSAARAEHWGFDRDAVMRHVDIAARAVPRLAGLWADVYTRPANKGPVDVDEDLYGGFLSNDDRRTLERLRPLSGPALAEVRPAFADRRLDELLFRYRARNFPETLSETEQAQWHSHCVHRLHDGAGGGLTLAAFMERIDELSETADQNDDERAQDILGALVDYATDIAPERD